LGSSHLNTNIPLQRRLKKYFSGINLDSNRRIANYFKWADQKLIEELYTDDFRNMIDGYESVEPLLSYLDSVHEDRSDLEKMLALEQRFFLTDHNLLYTDKMSMAVGVEARVPFLDIDLVNFASDIPKKYLQKGAVGKWVFKKAMEPYLPKDIIYRSKTGFGAPLRHWMQNEFHELIGDLLSSKSIKDRGIFSDKAVKQLLYDNSSGSVDASHTILSILCLEIWCRNYIDL
jgi:asparagine synthase (glutamine-hydrolysing)